MSAKSATLCHMNGVPGAKTLWSVSEVLEVGVIGIVFDVPADCFGGRTCCGNEVEVGSRKPRQSSRALRPRCDTHEPVNYQGDRTKEDKEFTD